MARRDFRLFSRVGVVGVAMATLVAACGTSVPPPSVTPSNPVVPSNPVASPQPTTNPTAPPTARVVPANLPSGKWTAGPNMLEARADDGTATLLEDGTMLEVGGPNKKAEIYDPASNIWTSVDDTHQPHGNHTATLLADGTVLIAGGNSGASMLSAEIFDPTTRTWTEIDPMSEARGGHTATLLPDGRVLVVGGFGTDGETPLASSEIYDPEQGAWSSAEDMENAGGYQNLIQLTDGRVLVAGGEGVDGALASAAIFDPATESWTAVEDMAHARSYATAARLDDGMVLVAGGGANARRLLSAELFDPESMTWSDTGNLTEARSQAGAVLLADGRMLEVGGNQTHNATAETYNPSTRSWLPTGQMTAWRASPQVTLLADGRAFVLGGFTDDPTSTELFDPTTGGPVATRPPWFGRCEVGCQGPISAGTFTSEGFLPGMSMTVEDGWFNTADYPEEIQLEQGDNVLRFWRNVGAITPTRELIEDVARTPEGITDWLVNNPNIDASAPEQTTVGGVPATTISFTISPENVNVDPECPSNVRSCLSVLWIAEGGHDLAIGYGEAIRLYLMSVEHDGETETIVASLDSPSSGSLTGLTTLVEPILESVTFP